MADFSLDDYIGFNKNRLGPKISPGKANLKITTNSAKKQGPRFNVVGLGTVKRNFDARQKLQNQNKKPVNDARVNLSQRTTFSDARMKIQNKRAGGGGGVHIKRPIPRITAPSPGHKATDVRIKIKSSQQTKPADARQTIKSRLRAPPQQANQRPFQGQQGQRSFQGQTEGETQVTVTGVGRIINQNNQPRFGGENILVRGGSLQKTISSGQQQNIPPPQHNLPIKKTIQNKHFAPMPSSRVGNNIVIAPEDPYVQNLHIQQEYTSYEDSPTYTDPPAQQPAYNPHQLADMPMIRIQNESYSRPPPPVVPTPPPEPVYRHQYYADIDADMVHVPQVAPPLRSHVDRSHNVERSHVNPAHRTHTDRLHLDRSHMDRPHTDRPHTDHSHLDRPHTDYVERSAQNSTQRSLIQSRLGDDPQVEAAEQDGSPLQGYRVLITNLNHVVSQDDVLELFGVVGALKKVKLLRPGNAEVVFVRREEAIAAIRKYNNRELDGQPMHVVLASSPQPAKSPRASSQVNQDIARLQKTSAVAGEATPVDVDISLLHKALFKTSSKDEPPMRPVTFTVKI